jgi:Cu/Zn superoxide dismutase
MYSAEWITRAVLLLGAALLAAAVASGTSAGAQQANSTELQLTESRDSGVSGTATLRDVEGGVEVTLAMQNLPAAGVEHINHIHGGGTCADDRADNPAPVTIPLKTITAGEDGTGSATTTLEGVTLEELQDPSEQQRYVAFHAEQEEDGGVPPVISCADLATSSGAQTASGERTVTVESTTPAEEYEEYEEYESTSPLPKSGGVTISTPSMLLPAVALLIGSGIMAYALLRRR